MNSAPMPSSHDSKANEAKLGRVIIISGPSGAGKSTVVKRLLRDCDLPLRLSISATTRQPRQGETDGVDYFFLSLEEFQQRRENGDFLECKEVFGRGDWYGTLADVVSTGRNEGFWLILEIDVEGAISLMDSVPDAISFFVHPGSIKELDRRLTNRKTETRDVIERRLEVAAIEMEKRQHYQYEIINAELDATVAQICNLLHQHNGDSNACSKN